MIYLVRPIWRERFFGHSYVFGYLIYRSVEKYVFALHWQESAADTNNMGGFLRLSTPLFLPHRRPEGILTNHCVSRGKKPIQQSDTGAPRCIAKHFIIVSHSHFADIRRSKNFCPGGIWLKLRLVISQVRAPALRRGRLFAALTCCAVVYTFPVTQ
jgi:hypothetical protein